MADAATEPQPTEVQNPPVAEVAGDKAEGSDANAETSVTAETATEEKPSAEPTNTEAISKPATEETGTEKQEAEDSAATNDGKPSIFNPPEGMLRVSGRNQQKKFVKSDPSSLPETDDPREIRKQAEFYFGDSNLPDDKFLWEQIGGEENKAIPLKLIHGFSRMRRFKPYEAVVKALKACNFFVIEGAEGEETIRRKNAVDMNKRNKREERSIYVKGFGDETSSTQFDIEAFFAQYGQFDSVRLRRADGPEKVFKGSVFVEWSDKETADKFMALDPAPQWKGHPLLIMWKVDYMQQKTEAIRDGKIPLSGPRKFGRGRGGRGNFRGNDRGGDKSDWKNRREQDQKNGFSDRRNNNQRGRGRGRGRGNNRGGRDGRDNRTDGDKENGAKPAADGRPRINVSKEGAKILEESKTKSGETNGKRAREADGSTGEPPVKKVDAKPETSAST
ncbi:hypothetical protein GGS20DRAFT_548289 [Poronia punctata]|nr:hypothetical protein GGS20DRAFT_548289 [Poronia punctata]